jgi:hypothetical protein
VNLNRLPTLAYAYGQSDSTMSRALIVMRHAVSLDPDREDIAAMYQQFLEVDEAGGSIAPD